MTPVPALHQHSILVVDDTRDNLRLLARMLSEQGYHVRTVTSGQRALVSAQFDPPDLVLLDIMMPEMDGYAVCAAMKADERTCDIPIIFISALNEVFDKVKAFSVGGVDYITKPFQLEEVLVRVTTHLKLRAMHWQLQQQNMLLQQEIAERKRAEKRLQDELHIARQVQQSLLPPECPNWNALEVVCCSIQAQEVGGDFYLYHAFKRASDAHSGRRYVLAVGDVSGKGMPAALLMSAAMASFRSIVGKGLEPAAFLAQMDQAIAEHTRSTNQNCALTYLEILVPWMGTSEEHIAPPPPEDDMRPVRLRVANAGGMLPIIKHRDGQVAWVTVEGLPLGVGLEHNQGYREVALEVVRGDMVILTSDGMLEAMNSAGELFGFERMEEVICTGPPNDASAMLDHLTNVVQAFIGDAELHDDMTILVMRV